ncbi:MAG: hypothetical protein Q9M76_05420 [Candidatus Dojkabacteria bacterium]|nr:hypothetical protein [Candidatus Dojkabacteria bacterium]
MLPKIDDDSIISAMNYKNLNKNISLSLSTIIIAVISIFRNDLGGNYVS